MYRPARFSSLANQDSNSTCSAVRQIRFIPKGHPQVQETFGTGSKANLIIHHTVNLLDQFRI